MQKAENSFARARKILEIIHKEKSESMALLLLNIASLRDKIGNENDAERLYKQSINLLEILKVDPNEILGVQIDLANFYSRYNKYKEAVDIYSHVFYYLEFHHSDNNNLLLFTTEVYYARLQYHLKQYNKAENLYDGALYDSQNEFGSVYQPRLFLLLEYAKFLYQIGNISRAKEKCIELQTLLNRYNINNNPSDLTSLKKELAIFFYKLK